MKFSETLKNRRHELGLTISQASSVLKLKESVLIAFEEGDFENMPKSGYAQGMLASYARYLGLSPRELVDMYSEELYEYIHGSSSHDLRRRTRDTRSGRIIDGYDVPNESESRPKAYVQLQSYLPTAGGPMGDYGAFATTSGVHSRSTGAPVPTTTSIPGTNNYSQTGYVGGRTYNPSYTTGRPSRATSARKRSDGGSRSSLSRGLRRDDITTRRVSRDQFIDDRAFDDEAVPYEAAASEQGRRSSHGIASLERPNVDRTRLRGRDPYARNPRPSSSGGIVGGIIDWFSDSRHALFAVIAALGLVLTIIVISSIRGCVASDRSEDEVERTVGVTPAQTSDTSTQTNTGQNAATSTGASEQVPIEITTPTAPSVVMVKVSVAEGQVSWLEIISDGESIIADTVNGPWEQTFDVKTQLVVRAGDISAVSVFVNGEQQQFEMKSSGVGTITVDGPPQTEADKAKAEGTEGEDGEKTDEESESESPEPGSKNSDGDEFVTTYDGYDIYQDKNGVMYFIDEETGAKYNAADGTPYTG